MAGVSAAAVAVAGVVVLVVCVGSGEAAVHHVAGGDQGWDASSDLASWSIGRSFAVGDNLWFAYSAAQESIAELASQAEYESCDVTNPIRTYASGLDRVELNQNGNRYFASSTSQGCRSGLKLHIQVGPDHEGSTTDRVVGAAGPLPSGAARVAKRLLESICSFPTLLWFVSFL